MNAFSEINPGGIILNADGSITFRNTELKQAISNASTATIKPAADNYGSCVNAGTCTGANNNCTNTGNCKGANNLGCKDLHPL